MEKLLYVLWKRAEQPADDLAAALRGPVGRDLVAAGAKHVTANVADDAAAFGSHLRISQIDEPMTATLSLWLDSHLDRGPIERRLAAEVARLAGYLVVESVPIVNTAHPAAAGARLAGLCTVAFLEKPPGMEHEAWRDQWQGHHTRVAIETQSTFLYVQNLVVRALTPGAPPWTAIVEECFPEAAATDPMVFYDARGDEKRLRENQRRMMESCRKFIDFSTIESHPMSAFVITD